MMACTALQPEVQQVTAGNTSIALHWQENSLYRPYRVRDSIKNDSSWYKGPPYLDEA